MELINIEGLNPLFFIKKYNNLKLISFSESRLLKENYFDAFTIDLNQKNGKFNLGIKW